MSLLLNYLYTRFTYLNFLNPLVYIDLLLAIFLMVSFFVYMRRFPSFRVIIGAMLLLLASVFFFLIDFLFTAVVFGFASLMVLFSFPLIFSSEIRHYLGKLGRFSYIPRLVRPHSKIFVRNLVDAVYELAEREIGGTLVIARQTGLGQTIDTGFILDARFSSKLLQSIFFPKSPLHDGAVIIRDERIVAAGCLLPIRAEVKLEPPFGTRHKSAISITTDTDALVLVISEQRGEISLAENGRLEINLDRVELTQKLEKLLT